MIEPRYKKIYEAFIEHYKDVHVCPWHEISEEKLNNIYDSLINKMDVKDKYTFFYMMSYIVKRLSGLEDAHTDYEFVEPLPINFKIIENEILINYPERLKGSTLLTINNIDMNRIVEELEEIITYGTEGRRRSRIEDYLFNRVALLSLPSLRGNKKIVYKIKKLDGSIEELEFDNEQKYKEGMFDTEEYLFGNPGKFGVRTKKDFQEKVTEELRKPDIFEPDVYVSTTKEDYINGVDTVLEYALSYSKNNLLSK